MADREQATPTVTAREILPRSASVIAAFRRPGGLDTTRRDTLMAAAEELAANHRRQWHAEDSSRDPRADAAAVAANKRRIDALNARRVALVEQIDAWVTERLTFRAGESLHTETVGTVIDRMAIAWVRATTLINSDAPRDHARIALRQLAELATAYDDLVRDVAAGRRRLPRWRPLKSYRSEP